ncbi:LysR substrate-binding domain-containing protein [Variovorax sp. RT4R15]|uniref:LysR substrate-binding domain-containing protein n=1 Tax=Variovorax sp. RT4R15 TaxID=3443737 RepID=UPI003F48118E
MATHLDLRVLASFLVVAEELSFTRAAKRLHMTQPPLSLQIKQLEGQLGVSLFERTNRSVRLTAAGETLRAEAEKLFALEDRARQLVARVGRGEDGGHISIGFNTVASLHLVPTLLRRFSARVPSILFSLKEISSDAQVSALLRNELDVGLVRPPVVDSRLEARCLLKEPQILAVPSNHPLAVRSKVHVRDLRGEVLVTFERRAGRYAHDLMMRWLSEHDVVPSQLHDVMFHNAMMAAVSGGLGVALVPASAGFREVTGVVFRRFSGSPSPKIELWIAFRKQAVNPMTPLFLEEAMAYVASYRHRLPR